ncbi:uncharacterized protein LOC130813467 [Amaranthus tricolor]|uniref:uncharacterized protein LOC130813467 n=1 Tax=Amaranthus tricolor TaxID=29722 RepID=UPI002587F244|nr:uncharacterized protein LOC130813467 [Amaranthus tricolor]
MLGAKTAAANKENRIGPVVVTRDDVGTILLAASKTIWTSISVERVELEAFYWAAVYVKGMQCSNVIFKGDAQIVVDALQHKISRDLHNQVHVTNILDLLSNVGSFSFYFCFREANNVAHRLARWASTSICSKVLGAKLLVSGTPEPEVTPISPNSGEEVEQFSQRSSSQSDTILERPRRVI